MSVYFTVRITDEDPEPSNLKPLKVIFNDMLRLLHGTTRAKKVPIKTMLQSLKILSLNQLAAYDKLMEVWRARNISGYPLGDLFQFKEPTCDLNITRSQSSIAPTVEEKGVEATTRNNLVYQASRLWNLSPPTFQNCTEISTAKDLLQQYVVTLPV